MEEKRRENRMMEGREERPGGEGWGWGLCLFWNAAKQASHFSC